MKVAIVVHQFLPRYTTGTERYACLLGQGFRERGVEVRVFSGEDDGLSLLAEDDYAVEGLPVHRLTRHRSLDPDPIRGEYDSALTEAAFARFLEAERPDLVHFFHLYNLGGGLMDAAWAHGVPYFVHLMDYWFLCPRIQMLDHEGGLCAGPREASRCARCASEVDGNYRPLTEADDATGLAELAGRWPWLRDRLQRAAGVFAPSRYLRDRFIENGLDAERLHHLAYGVAPAPAPDPAGAPAPRASGAVRFGYLGNLATFKGAHLALEAFTRLDGDGLSLQVFGDYFFREPEQMEACRRRVSEDPRITMRGRYEHEDLTSILDGLDVVVVPSLWHENTPFVVLESIRAGTPVIASRVGGITEAVREGEDGLLFDRGDVEDLTRQMERFARGEGPSRVTADHIPPLDANVEALLEHYRAAVVRHASPDREEVDRVRAALRDRLYGAMQAIGGRFLEAGGESGRDLDVLEILRDAAGLRAELAGHREVLAVRARENHELRAGVKEMESGFREEIEAREAKASALEADLEGHRVTLARLTADLDAHRTTVAALESDLAGHRRELERLEGENRLRAAAETELREDLDRHRTLVAGLTREREDFQKVVADLEENLTGHRGALEDLTADRDACVARWRDARDSVGEQAAAIRRLEATLTRFEAEIDSTAQGRNL